MNSVLRRVWGYVKNNPVAISIALATLTRIIYIFYTHYIAEDAFITFQFSRRIAEGLGFVYNPGQPIYGTTTPFFTLLLAAWMKLIPDPRIGAWLLNVTAFTGMLVFTAASLKKLGISQIKQIMVIALMTFSSRLWSADTGGMETPLVLFLMAVSWYLLIQGSFIWTGFFCGLLLWTRIDLALWMLVLAFPAFKKGVKTGVLFLISAMVVYLPWVIYATLTFGSPIPNTITAKAIAYSSTEINSIYSHFMVLFRLFSLSDLAIELFKLTNVISACMVCLSLWMIYTYRKQSEILILVLFIIIQGAVLVLYRTTYFLRYFVPLLWAFQILSGLAFGQLWEKAMARSLVTGIIFSLVLSTGIVSFGALFLFYLSPLAILESYLDYVLYTWVGFWVIFLLVTIYEFLKKKAMFPQSMVKGCIILIMTLLSLLGLENTRLVWFLQKYRHEASLTRIGTWLNQNTPDGSTVMLEPLGYIGYYANRFMLDEVGLVTPEIIALKARGIRKTEEYYRILRPDFIVVHCDDSLTMQTKGSGVLIDEYQYRAVFNPLDYEPTDDDHSARGIFARNACYEIWERQ